MGMSASTFAVLGLGAGIFGAVAETQEAEIKAQAQEYAAGSDIYNASIARQESKLAQVKAKLEISRKRKAQEALVSEQQVLYATSGVRIDEGTPLVVMQDTFYETELDMLIMKFNADVESQFLESEARQSELQAAQRRTVATQERAAGQIRAGKTLLSSISKFGMAFAGGGDSLYSPATPGTTRGLTQWQSGGTMIG